jgi:hypothetical protein
MSCCPWELLVLQSDVVVQVQKVLQVAVQVQKVLQVAVQVQKVLQVAVQQLLFLAGAARRAVQVQKSVVVVQSLGRATG